ncbi:ubiquinone/menaquinone biosynthesis methyltransferase [bacterium]|nr:ubiquinone/menaquinone biosynthesis methyltransferase [bacterium]
MHSDKKYHSEKVRELFTRLTGEYDRMNRILSLGQDLTWRRKAVHLARIPRSGRFLDMGAGTGELALEALRQDSTASAWGVDFTKEMMMRGRSRNGGLRIQWIRSDALDLPFPDASFDAVVSGYILRNVFDLKKAFQEQHRVLKPGGFAVNLDTTPPPADLFHRPVRFYINTLVPLIGRILSGEPDAYSYLSESTAEFKSAEEIAEIMRQAGFRSVRFRRLMLGSMAVHRGRRQSSF